MTPQDAQIAAMNARQFMERAAECQVLKELLADLISRDSGQSYADALAEIDGKVKQRQEKYLLDVEKLAPHLAAQMDLGKPPPQV